VNFNFAIRSQFLLFFNANRVNASPALTATAISSSSAACTDEWNKS
jgi:hypothetical protein